LLLAGLSLAAAGLVGGQELIQPIVSPTPSAASPTAHPPATATENATETATPAPAATSQPPTPTWTPFPTATATPPAVSPLGFLAAQATPPIPPAPLPQGLFGPRLAPVTATAVVTTGTDAPVAESGAVSPTLSITEALQMPVEAAAPVEPPAPLAPTPALAPTPDGAARSARVPILMYHYLSTPPAGADRYRLDLSVTPAMFDAHLDALQQAGYTTISLYTLLAHLTEGAPLPGKPVIITFDDGYRDTYENAFPRLQARGMTATFFVVTDFIDEQRPEYLTWEMARAMLASGMSIESHGRNHVSLKGKDRDYLIWQALGSLETIQYELGVRPRFVSYPAGDFDALTVEVFRSASYWAAVTTVQGATHHGDNLFQLRRVRVHGTTTADDLLRLVALDW
jgi:peptidoglycan/xylan/chitin deacetylase (PgdA/CDA1 family)